MPRRPFDKDIELAKLQAKISKEQTDTYAFVSVMFAGVIGFTALAYSTPAYLGGQGSKLSLSGLFAGFAIIFLGAALLRLWRWGKFYENVVWTDFDKIYRKERIDLEA